MDTVTEELDIHRLYGALTRPAMIGGVTLEYQGLNLMVSVSAFILQGNLLYGLIGFPIHMVGWLICREDPCFFKTFLQWLRLPAMPNQAYWGVRSYVPF